jgi:group I intron endonuclease
MVSGIYMIRCQSNSRIYVGSSSNIYERWSHHRGMLKRGVHHNIYLQRSWNLYGENDFVFSILEEVANPSLLIDKEQQWIKRLRAKTSESGFNIAPCAGTQLGFNHAEETKKHLSQVLTGKKKPVGFGSRVSKTLKKRGICPSQEASKKAADARRGVPPSKESIEHIRTLWFGKRQSAKHIKARIAPLRKEYILTAPSGEEIFVNNLPEFCRQHNLQSSHICHVCKGKRKHHKGWVARYA